VFEVREAGRARSGGEGCADASCDAAPAEARSAMRVKIILALWPVMPRRLRLWAFMNDE
jgi:hypothetical protein